MGGETMNLCDTMNQNVNTLEPPEVNLRVELQSVRRLPRSRHILFTLHAYSDPLPRLAALPKGAAVLRQALLDLDEKTCVYRGMTEDSVKKVAEYLEGMAGSYV